jgi:hypothetical protein
MENYDYWNNFVKVRQCTRLLGILNNIKIARSDDIAKKTTFGIHANLDDLEKKYSEDLKKCYGAYNVIGEPLTTPCGSLIVWQ